MSFWTNVILDKCWLEKNIGWTKLVSQFKEINKVSRKHKINVLKMSDKLFRLGGLYFLFYLLDVKISTSSFTFAVKYADIE